MVRGPTRAPNPRNQSQVLGQSREPLRGPEQCWWFGDPSYTGPVRKDNKDVAELLFESGAEVNKQAQPLFRCGEVP